MRQSTDLLKLVRANLFSIGVVIAILALDRATKRWALQVLSPIAGIRIFPFLYLTYAENTGAAFSSFRGSNAALAVVSVLILTSLFYFRRDWIKDAWTRFAFILVVSGAVGNLWDRVLYGHVIDFIDFRVWPIFNVADSCITIGGTILVVLGLRRGNGE